MAFLPFSFCFLLLLCLIPVSAQNKPNPDSCNEKLDSCDTDDSALDDFPEISADLLAKATTIQDFKREKQYFQFKVKGLDEDEAYRYRIYRCGCNPPQNNGYTTLFTHSNALYVDEHPTISAMYEIDPDYVVEQLFVHYFSAKANVYEAQIRERIESGNIKTVPTYPSNFSKNLSVIKSSVTTSVIGAYSVGAYQKFDDDLPPFLIISEALEKTPIGRAVWIYIIGIIMGEAKRAKELLEGAVKSYEETVKAIQDDEKYVYSAFYNAPFTFGNKTTWTQPGENQYVTDLGNDALTAYRYYNREEQKNFTEVVRDFSSARILLRASLYNLKEVIGRGIIPTIEMFVNNASTSASVRAKLRTMRAVKCGNVWYSKRVRSDGADDSFGSAIFNPHLVLQDFRRILHSADGEDITDLTYLGKYSGRLANCTDPKIGSKGENEDLRENSLKVKNFTWYALENLLPNLTVAMKEGGYPDFDLRWKKENYEKEKDGKDVTATLVAYTSKEDEDKFKKESTEIFKETLANAGGPPVDNGGIGAGGIIGIIIGVLIVLMVITFLCIIFRRPKQPMGGDWQEAPQSGTAAEGDMGGDPFDERV